MSSTDAINRSTDKQEIWCSVKLILSVNSQIEFKYYTNTFPGIHFTDNDPTMYPSCINDY